MRHWKAKGIPVDRLGTPQAAAAVDEEWSRLEGLSSGDLKIQCELHSVPAEACSDKQDLLTLLKDIALWEAMPLTELKKEGASLNVGGKGAVDTLDNSDEWTQQ